MSAARLRGRRYQLAANPERVESAPSRPLGQGPGIEVLAPLERRQRLANASRSTAGPYRRGVRRGKPRLGHGKLTR